MSLTTTHTVIGSLDNGKKIVKSTLVGQLGASGGIYFTTPHSEVTDVLSIQAASLKTKMAVQFCPTTTSGNQVVVYPLVLENAGLSGTGWAAAISAEILSGTITLYTLGV